MSRVSELFSRFAADAHFEMHAEDVDFTPAGGVLRRIKAIVHRNPLQRINAAGRDVTPTMMIEVMNDPVKGISSAELNAFGNDKVTLAYRPGTTALVYGVHIPDSSFGAWVDGAIMTLDVK